MAAVGSADGSAGADKDRAVIYGFFAAARRVRMKGRRRACGPRVHGAPKKTPESARVLRDVFSRLPFAFFCFVWFCFPQLAAGGEVGSPLERLLCWRDDVDGPGSEVGLGCNSIVTRIFTFNFGAAVQREAAVSLKRDIQLVVKTHVDVDYVLHSC